MKALKRAVVAIVGRERANRVSAPFYDWRAWRRSRQVLRALPSSGLCVNLGCGPVAITGWVNVDAVRGSGVDIVWDLRGGLPFAEKSCTAIVGEHVIEHLSKGDGERLVAACYRALEPGGVLRLSTPDAGRFLRSYAGDGAFLRHPEFPRPMETPLDRINVMMREDGLHLWAYDSPSLQRVFRRAGFAAPLEQPFGESQHTRTRQIDLEARAFESLYVEGIK